MTALSHAVKWGQLQVRCIDTSDLYLIITS